MESLTALALEQTIVVILHVSRRVRKSTQKIIVSSARNVDVHLPQSGEFERDSGNLNQCSTEAGLVIRLGKRSVKVTHKVSNKNAEKYHMIAKYQKGARDRASYLRRLERVFYSTRARSQHTPY